MGRVNFRFSTQNRGRRTRASRRRRAFQGHVPPQPRQCRWRCRGPGQGEEGRTRHGRPGIQGNGEGDPECVAEVAPAFDGKVRSEVERGRLDLGGPPAGSRPPWLNLVSGFLPRCGVHRPAALRSGSTDRRTVGGAWRALSS